MVRKEEPQTHIVAVQQAMATLNYDEMLALSDMYERWVFTEERLTPEQRTRLIQLCADYERIAEYVGCDWTARDPGSGVDAIQFVARLERQTKE